MKMVSSNLFLSKINKCVAMAIVFLLFSATYALAGIVGSKHDFSATTWVTNQEICVACHTPHNAVREDNAPLWNHAVSTVQNYVTYSSPTFQVTDQPAGNTKLCLSCHDGTVAVDSYGGRTGTEFMTVGSVGTDLSNDHPVSFTFEHEDMSSVGSCGNCHATTASSPTAGFSVEDLVLPFFKYGASGDPKLECATCHDPHNDGNTDSLLRMSNAGSALCIWCHG